MNRRRLLLNSLKSYLFREEFDGGAPNPKLWSIVDTTSAMSVSVGNLVINGGLNDASWGDPSLVAKPTYAVPYKVGLTLDISTPSVVSGLEWHGFNADASTPGGRVDARSLYAWLNGGNLIYIGGVEQATLVESSNFLKTVMISGGGSLWYHSKDGLVYYPVWYKTAGGSGGTLYPAYSTRTAVLTSSYMKIYQGQVKPPVLSGTAAASTPATGNEIFANPGAEGTYVDGVAPDWEKKLTDGVWSEETIAPHGGLSAQKFVGNLTADTGVQPTQINVATGVWYKFNGWVNTLTGTVNVRRVNARLPNINNSYTSSGNYFNIIQTDRATSDGGEAIAVRQVGITPASFIADDFSLKPVTLTSLLSDGGNVGTQYGVYDDAITVASGYQAGIVACLDSATTPLYYLHAYIDPFANKAYLLKVVNGVTTELIAGAITYGAGKKLRLVVVPGAAGLSNASLAIYYGTTDSEAIVGTVQTPVDLTGFGTIVKAFDTSGSATNTLTVNI